MNTPAVDRAVIAGGKDRKASESYQPCTACQIAGPVTLGPTRKGCRDVCDGRRDIEACSCEFVQGVALFRALNGFLLDGDESPSVIEPLELSLSRSSIDSRLNRTATTKCLRATARQCVERPTKSNVNWTWFKS